MILGVAEEEKEKGAINLPIALQAATTDGYSIHIGTISFFLFITNSGMTDKGKDIIPITFSVIESAIPNLSPPVIKSLI